LTSVFLKDKLNQMPKKRKKTTKKPKKQKKKVKVEVKPEERSDIVKKTKIRVIGVGGGGGSIVSEIASRMKKATFVVANTDKQALRASSRKALHFQFGQDITHGLGTGMNDELGREAAQKDKDKIKKLLEGQDLCIIVSCLGGGAGSGAAPIFAKISRDLGNITFGIFTLPFKFEGEKKIEIAKESLKRIKNHLNALSVIPNERVFQIIDKSTPLKQALSTVNKSLSDSLEGLIETIYQPGLINIDFADFKTILEGRGRLAYLNTEEIQRKEGSAKELMEKVLNSPLYPYGIRGARGVLFNIVGEKKLSLSEVGEISRDISELTNPDAKIIFGISQSKKYSDTIKTTLLATGCATKIFPAKARKKRKKKKKIVKEKPSPRIKRKRRKKYTQKRKKIRKTTPKKKKGLLGIFSRRKKGAKKVKISVPAEEAPEINFPTNEDRLRKNGLQIKKEAEEEEKEMVEKEKFWETPAFLRRNQKNKE